MQRTVRAAAFAAVAFSFCAAVFFAGPTLATVADEPTSVPYAAHAAVTVPEEGDIGLNPLDERAETPSAEAEPAVTHAITPAFPETDTADEPAERDGRSLATLVEDYSDADTPDAETECLARAVYYESKGEPLTGQLTVAEVIINRARSGRFPSTVCGVVRQAGQFSFVRRGVIPQPPEGSRDWRIAVAIAQIAMQDLADGAAPRALFFHARRVNPGWRLTRVATVGNHVFYR